MHSARATLHSGGASLRLTIGVAACALGCYDAPDIIGGSGKPSPFAFAPKVSPDSDERWRITFTPDGRTAYFAGSEEFFPVSRRATIYRSTLAGGRWSEPELAEFSGRYPDIDPAISPDGSRLYFSSIRPVAGVARSDLDIWMVERAGDGWSRPVHLGRNVNSDADELYPSASFDGTLYFGSGPAAPRVGAHWDVFRARRNGAGFAARERLGSNVNREPSVTDPTPQSAWDFNPEISADGAMLVFTSLRTGGYGLGDLYVTHLVDGGWTPATNLGDVVNTASDEYHPTLSRDGRLLYFVRRRSRGGDFLVVARSALDALRR